MPIARNLERAPLHLSCRQLESPQTSPDCNFQTRFIAKKMFFLGFSGPGERIQATSLQSRGFRPQGRRLLTFNPSPKGLQGFGRDPSWELHRKGRREPKTLSAVIVRVSLPESVDLRTYDLLRLYWLLADLGVQLHDALIGCVLKQTRNVDMGIRKTTE